MLFCNKNPAPCTSDTEDGDVLFLRRRAEGRITSSCSWLHALLVVEDLLADAQVLGSDLQQLVLSQELEAALEAQLADGDEAQSIVRAGSTGIGQVLGLADVDIDASPEAV
mgnify:CR=1 FL=1